MKRLVLLLVLVGCGEPDFPMTCERADDRGAMRCFNDHGICYAGLDGNPACQCNGDDAHTLDVLCDTLTFDMENRR